MVSQALSYIAICCFVVQFSFAQSNLGARLGAMGDNASAVKDVWNVNGNFAGISAIDRFTVAASYAKYLFDTELAEQAIVVAIPFQRSVFGIGFQRYGITEYNEIKATAGITRKFGDKLAIGINGNYHQLKISNYGATQSITFDVGIQYELNEEVLLGAYVVNPAKLNYQTNANLQTPYSYQIGLGYKASSKLLLAASVKKENNLSADVSTGLEYQILEILFLRGGISLKPFKQYAGVGFSTSKLKIDVAFESYPNIGYIPQIALAYAF